MARHSRVMAHQRCMHTESHSQWGEDRVLLPTLLRAAGGQPGIFVELGAFTGKAFSNTFALEHCHGWRGLLIEANAGNFARLLSIRRSPRNTLINEAICTAGCADSSCGHDEGGQVNITSWSKEISGIPRLMAKGSLAYRYAGRNVVSAVRCHSLRYLMNTAHLSSAHFLSLDVEGAEEEVLLSVDPRVFAVVMVELDGSDEARDERVHQLLQRAGLSHQPQLHVFNSRVYVRQDVADVVPALPRTAAFTLSQCITRSASDHSEDVLMLPTLLNHGGQRQGRWTLAGQWVDEGAVPNNVIWTTAATASSKGYFAELLSAQFPHAAPSTRVTRVLEVCFGWKGVVIGEGGARRHLRRNLTLTQLLEHAGFPVSAQSNDHRGPRRAQGRLRSSYTDTNVSTDGHVFLALSWAAFRAHKVDPDDLRPFTVVLLRHPPPLSHSSWPAVHAIFSGAKLAWVRRLAAFNGSRVYVRPLQFSQREVEMLY